MTLIRRRYESSFQNSSNNFVQGPVASVVSHIHFETRRDRPKVFKITRELIRAARKRNQVPANVKSTLGIDLADLSPLATATAFVSSNDVVADPRFPLRDLASVAPHLKLIHITGAGIEPLLPLNWLPKGVALTNNSGVHVQKTAEFAAMAMLMLNARMPQIVTNQRSSNWSQIFTPSIKGKTIVIIGLGDMGGTAAREAKQLGLRVIGIRRRARSHRYADEVFELRHLRRALRQADFIFVAAPLTPASQHLLDKDLLSSVKAGAGLINVGRAGVVDYGAVRAALKSGALSGAILDVFEREPLPSSSPLWRTPNLILTPHCSSDDLDRYMPLTLDLVFENLSRVMAGRPLKNRVNPRRGY
jgi:phosphoglycerate dehydrogenase-like enzyme